MPHQMPCLCPLYIHTGKYIYLSSTAGH